MKGWLTATIALLSTLSGSAQGRTAVRPIVTSSPALPTPVVELLKHHCSGCHDADSVLDIGALPAVTDRKEWLAIRTALETGRMPLQPGEEKKGSRTWTGPGTTPPALGPGYRQKLVSDITAMLAPLDTAAVPSAEELSFGEWLAIVRQAAVPLLSASDLDIIVDRWFELAPEARPFLVSVDVCSRIVEAEAERRPEDRTLLRGMPIEQAGRIPTAVSPVVVGRLFELIYQRAPTAREVARGIDRLRRLAAGARGRQAPVVGLCATYLGGLQAFRTSPPPGDDGVSR